MDKQFDIKDYFPKEVNLSEINQALAGISKNMHNLGITAFGPGGRRNHIESASPEAQKNSLAELAKICIHDFDEVYNQLPPNHHLLIGIPQSRYEELLRSEQTAPYCITQRNLDNTADLHFIKIDRKQVPFTSSPLPTLTPGTSTLEIGAIGTENPDKPSIYFELSRNTATSLDRIGSTSVGAIYPEEITSLEAKQNKQFDINAFF